MKCFVFFALLMSPLSLASNRTLSYDPEVVELTGVLDLQTFPGPPNYESIQNGDNVERHFYLRLDAPVDVKPIEKQSAIDTFEMELNVKIIQLAINGEDDPLWSRFRKTGKGGHVKIVGKLFHRFTGHHHSRVLLSVEKMDPINKDQ